MKKLYQKIIVSILSLAVMGTVCTINTFATNDTATEPEKMIFDNTYQAWLTNGTNNPANGIKTADIVTTSTGVSLTNPNSKSPVVAVGCYFAGGPLTSSNRPGLYAFTESGATMTITLPDKKAGYDLYSVGVTIGQNDATYKEPFDYEYSEDGLTWTKVTTKSYFKNTVGAIASYLNAYHETVKVSRDAKYLKITRNENVVTTTLSNGALEVRSCPGVMGFSCAYVPAINNDVIQVKAGSNQEIINLLSSGMMNNGENCFGAGVPVDIDSDTTEDYGLGFHNTENKKSIIFNAIDGYKITSVEADSYNNSNTARCIGIKLGEKTTKQTVASETVEKITVTSEKGEESFEVINDAYSGALYNIVITMEKIKLETSIDSAVDDGTKVDATATVSNLDLAEEASMELIIAGYDGDRFTGATTVTVYKNDADKTASLPIELPTGTKTVKVFLWKNLDTLVPVLAPIDAAVTTASAE